MKIKELTIGSCGQVTREPVGSEVELHFVVVSEC